MNKGTAVCLTGVNNMKKLAKPDCVMLRIDDSRPAGDVRGLFAIDPAHERNPTHRFPSAFGKITIDETDLVRLVLSPRECQVIYWVIEG